MKIGNLQIDKPLILAPMENVTDAPFRAIMRRLGADMVFTEFTSCEALIRDIEKADKKVTILDEERPIGIQIFGSNPDSMARAAQKIEQFKPDFIDINAGCWSRSHVSRGECAALLKDLPNFEKIVREVVKAVSVPVTVKTRLGWDKESIVILDAASMLEQAGAQALTVHCRTRNQGYKGKADWAWLEAIRKKISIPLIGNGDVKTPKDAKALFDLGCDGVMVGRQAVADPWIFQEIKEFINLGKILPHRSWEEKVKICMEHLLLSVKYKGDVYGIITFRKHYAGYLHGLPYAAKLRNDLMQMKNIEDIKKALESFSDKLHHKGIDL
ncbi:MAG: tRNA dihydrouridine synthase DusB [Candidatus Omnitrophica bacterium]|nr:tRNA dihydrouridine synthase DusB [Candidatus Omnitrophota bacterium]